MGGSMTGASPELLTQRHRLGRPPSALESRPFHAEAAMTATLSSLRYPAERALRKPAPE
jgi:hypothetical protein